MNDIVKAEESNVSVIQSPDTFIAQAIDQGSDVAVLSGLFDLKERWEKAEAKKAFDGAMLAWQEVRPVLKKTKDVKFGNNTAYSYCPLPDMEVQIKDLLAECGLTYRWQSVIVDGRDGQRCIITHTQGHSEYNEMFSQADTSGNKNDIQAIGSASHYLQRYSLKGALGLTEQDDDDDGVSSGDMPYIKLLAHNEAVRDNLAVILATKESLAEGDYENAAMYLYEMGNEVAEALRIAPRNGGIFTTEEVRKTKTNEFHAARTLYFENKEND